MKTKDEARLAVMDQVVGCTNCELHSQCLGPVPFHGPTPTELVVLGEAPGKEEDEQCQPFIGRAGQMMRKHLRRIGMDDQKVTYINTASCFPHGTPEKEHIEACADNKRAQLDLADPQFVLVVGKTALFGQRPGVEFKRVRGSVFKDDAGRINFVTYHPSAALRNGNFEKTMGEDLDLFAELLRGERTWPTLIADRCTVCGRWPDGEMGEMIDPDTALNYCEAHAPEHVANQLRLWRRSIDERIHFEKNPHQQAFAS